MSDKYSQLYEQINKICKSDFIYKNDSNLVFILGQSGSGKTTTLEKFKDISNVVLTELDYFRENRDFKKEDLKDKNELIYNFLNFFPRYNINYKYILQMYTEFLYDFVWFCTLYAGMNKDKIFIVSGRNLIYTFVENKAYGFSLILEDKYLKNCSIIIKNTSKFKSLFRASVRELNRAEGLPNKFNTLKHYYLNKNTKNDYEECQQIIDSLKERLIYL